MICKGDTVRCEDGSYGRVTRVDHSEGRRILSVEKDNGGFQTAPDSHFEETVPVTEIWHNGKHYFRFANGMEWECKCCPDSTSATQEKKE